MNFFIKFVFLFCFIFFGSLQAAMEVPDWVEPLKGVGIEAVIFDMDGTIINTHEVQMDAWIKVVEQLIDRSLNAQERILALGHFNCNDVTLVTYFKQNFDLEITPLRIKDLECEIFHTLIVKQLKYVKGFESFIKQLKQHGFKVAIGTNAAMGYLDLVNEILNLIQYFDTHTYSFEHVDGKFKPDPALFLHAAKKLGVSPLNCLVFGDAPNDLTAASAANMNAICIEHDLNRGLRRGFVATIPNYDSVGHVFKLFLPPGVALISLLPTSDET